MPTAAKRQAVRESFSRLPGHLIRRVHQASTAYFTEECGADLTAEEAATAAGVHVRDVNDAEADHAMPADTAALLEALITHIGGR